MAPEDAKNEAKPFGNEGNRSVSYLDNLNEGMLTKN
jgi:hypothetical protein